MRIILSLLFLALLSLQPLEGSAHTVELGRSEPGKGVILDYQVAEGLRLYYLGMNEDGMAILATGEGLGTMRTEPSPFLIDRGDLFRLTLQGFLDGEQKVYWIEVLSFDEDSIRLSIQGPVEKPGMASKKNK